MSDTGNCNSRQRRRGCGSDDNTIKIWDAHTGKLIHTFLGHIDSVQSVALSDGKRVVSGSTDGTEKIWSVDERPLIATMLASADGEWVTWIPEGYFIGSPRMIEQTLRMFRLNETLYPEDFSPRDNPNARRVAEALGSGLRNEPTPDVSALPSVEPSKAIGKIGV